MSVEVWNLDHVASALESVAKFAYVSGPVVGEKLVAHRGRQLFPELFGGKRIDQQWDILPPIAQRGQAHRKNGESKVEILPESARLCLRPQILFRGDHHSPIERNIRLRRTQTTKLPIFDRPQQ